MYLQKGGPVGRGVALQLDDLVQAALLLALLHADLLLLHQFLGDLNNENIFLSIKLKFKIIFCNNRLGEVSSVSVRSFS